MENNTENSGSLGVCCVCIKKYWFLESVYDEDEKKIKHTEKLHTCVPSEVWYNDYKICKNCIENLELAYQFVILCIKNETIRRETYNINTGPFRCNGCKKTFKQEARLKKHIAEFHKISITKVEPVVVEEYDLKESITDLQNVSEQTEDKPELITYLEIKLDTEQDEKRPIRTSVQNIVINENSDNDLDDNIENHLGDNFTKSESSESAYEEDYKPARRKRNTKKNRNKIRTIKQPKKLKKEKEIFKCEYCPEQFNTAKIHQKHTISKHTFERPFKCDQCDATYRGKDMLTVHKRTHTGETPYICSVCGKAFKSSHGLFVHNQLHSSEKAYACPLCPKAFKTQAHLRTHRVGVHTKPEELKYECPQCGHKFPFKGHLDKHLVRHSGIKNCPCRICGKMFVSNSDAELHIRRTHMNDNLYACKVCGKEFKSTDGLHKHLKTAHDIGDYKVPVHEKKLLCPYCPKMFPFNHKLQRHILTHTGEKPFKCALCSKGFRDRTDLRTHLKNAHQIVNNLNSY